MTPGTRPRAWGSRSRRLAVLLLGSGALLAGWLALSPRTPDAADALTAGRAPADAPGTRGLEALGPALRGREAPPSTGPARTGPARNLGEEGWPGMLARPPLAQRRVVQGRVLDEDEQPVDGIQIDVSCPDRTRARPLGSAPILTDRTGGFRIENAWLPLRIQAADNLDTSPSREVLVAAPTQTLLLRVSRGRWLRGRVLHPDGSPAASVPVMLSGEQFLRGGDSAADGRFAFRVPPDLASADLQAGWPRWSAAFPRAQGAGPLTRPERVPADAQEVVLRFEAAREIEGVVEGPDGRPCRAQLRLRPLHGLNALSGDAADTRTDDEGRFSFRGLYAGSWRLKATPSDSDDAGQRLTASAEREVVAPAEGLLLVCPEGAVLEGIVEGAPAGGLEVLVVSDGEVGLAGWGLASTDPEGRFRVRGLERLPLDLWVLDRVRGRWAHWQGREPASGLRLGLVEGASIRGRAEGDVPEGASVSAVQGRLYYEAPVREDGTFELRGLPPGTWVLEAHGTIGTGFPGGRTAATTDLVEAAAGSSGVLLRLRAP